MDQLRAELGDRIEELPLRAKAEPEAQPHGLQTLEHAHGHLLRLEHVDHGPGAQKTDTSTPERRNSRARLKMHSLVPRASRCGATSKMRLTGVVSVAIIRYECLERAFMLP